MKNKKINDLSALGGFVFSTNKEFDFLENQEDIRTPEDNKQHLEAHLDKKNRAGRIATVIKGLQGTDEELKDVSKKLKTLCGVGGCQKDGESIIQRNFRDKIMEFLKKE